MPVRVLRPDLRGSAARARPRRALRRRSRRRRHQPQPRRAVAGAPCVRDAIKYAARKGVTVVAAAGNDGYDVVSWPAADPSVIAVGAVRPGPDARGLLELRPRARSRRAGRRGRSFDSGKGPSDGVLAQTRKGGPAKFCFCFTASTSAGGGPGRRASPRCSSARSRAIGRAAIRERLLVERARSRAARARRRVRRRPRAGGTRARTSSAARGRPPPPHDEPAAAVEPAAQRLVVVAIAGTRQRSSRSHCCSRCAAGAAAALMRRPTDSAPQA